MSKDKCTRKKKNLKCVAANNRSSKYVKGKLIELKGKITKSPILFGDFSVHLIPAAGRTATLKINQVYKI